MFPFDSIKWCYPLYGSLTRKFQNEEISVTFDCQDESDGHIDEDEFFKQDDDDNSEEDDGDLDDYDSDDKYGINFQVCYYQPYCSIMMFSLPPHSMPPGLYQERW